FYLLVPRFFRPPESAARPGKPAAVVRHAAPPKLPLLIVSESERRRRRIESFFDGSVLSPVCLGGAGVRVEYLSALQPHGAVVDVSADQPVAPDALRTLAAAAIPLVRTSEEPHDEDGAVPLDSEIVAAIHREIVRAAAPRLLLVDDDERFRTVLLKYVQPICPEAAAIGDPRAALDGAADRADALILDLIMPDLDGFTLLAKLRDRAATVLLP